MASTRYDEPGPGQGGPWSGPGYAGYGRGPWGMGMRRNHPIETKPFFLTSEFAGLVIAILALLITTLSNDDVDARLFWILTTVLVSVYMLSRGIAKSGTKSRAFDPREELELGRRGGGEGGGATAER